LQPAKQSKKKQSTRLGVRDIYSQTRANNFAIASLSVFDQVSICSKKPLGYKSNEYIAVSQHGQGRDQIKPGEQAE
jgi:hypothetical protein